MPDRIRKPQNNANPSTDGTMRAGHRAVVTTARRESARVIPAFRKSSYEESKKKVRWPGKRGGRPFPNGCDSN